MSEARSIMASLAPVPEMWQMGSPCAHVGGRRLRQSRLCLTLLWHLLLSSLARLASAQDDGGDMGDDGSSMVDPSLLMEDDTLAGMGMGGPGGGRAGLSLSLESQTLLALQELGIMMGVAFMMAFMFMLIVYAEKLIDFLSLGYRRYFSKKEEEDEEADPAALVGTFKRYKN